MSHDHRLPRCFFFPQFLPHLPGSASYCLAAMPRSTTLVAPICPGRLHDLCALACHMATMVPDGPLLSSVTYSSTQLKWQKSQYSTAFQAYTTNSPARCRVALPPRPLRPPRDRSPVLDSTHPWPCSCRHHDNGESVSGDKQYSEHMRLTSSSSHRGSGSFGYAYPGPDDCEWLTQSGTIWIPALLPT